MVAEEWQVKNERDGFLEFKGATEKEKEQTIKVEKNEKEEIRHRSEMWSHLIYNQ